MSEIEPIQPDIVLQELEHWQDRLEQANRQVEYCERKIEQCREILQVTNVIWVPDNVWRERTE